MDTGQQPLGTNMYMYCLNDPVNLYDPNGYFALTATLAALGTAAVKTAPVWVPKVTGWLGTIGLIGVAATAPAGYVAVRSHIDTVHQQDRADIRAHTAAQRAAQPSAAAQSAASSSQAASPPPPPGNFNSNQRSLWEEINDFLGPNYTMKTSNAGEPILVSQDELRQVRFDIQDFHPHESSHVHFEWRTNTRTTFRGVRMHPMP